MQFKDNYKIEEFPRNEFVKYLLDLKMTEALARNIFPNIQFIVTSHSPFILNSLENVVIYDLEKNLLVENGLDDVPYEGVVEGYFGVDKLSDTLRKKFERYRELVKKQVLSDDEISEIAELELYLDEIPNYLAIGITTEYQGLKLEFLNREELARSQCRAFASA